jgi:hypothetical protein
VIVSAYINESYDLRQGFYILCATLVDSAKCDRIRALTRSLAIGSGKIHWHSEGPKRRWLLALAVAAFDIEHIAVIGRSSRLREERARRKCLETLLVELDRRAVNAALLESRQRGKDKLDTGLVGACRNKRLISQRLQVLFSPGAAEPLLWLPDIVSGALHLAEHGKPEHADQLAPSLTKLEIDAS